MLLTLCTVGFLISGYFVGVTFQWVKPDTRWIPPVCRMGQDTCSSVVFTRQARVFGPPNAVLGLLFYLLLAAAAIGGALDEPLVHLALLGISGATVVLGLFLTYSLLFVIRVRCVLCFTSHVVNLALFVILLTGG
ncbi:MAG: vitamin K epoxide reductase family protein [bacterium]